MKTKKPAFEHQGVKIYHSYKGTRALTYWFSMLPNHRAESDDAHFDLRQLPQKYRRGLSLEPTTTTQVCNEVLRRAIEDHCDFQSAMGGKYMSLWRSLLERVWNRT